MTSSGTGTTAGPRRRTVHPALYWTATGAFFAIFVGSVVLTFGDLDGSYRATAALGYPAYTVVPQGVAKALGLVAIAWNRSRLLTGLAFAGFFYDTALALAGHLVQQDAVWIGIAATGMLATVAAYLVHDRRHRAAGSG